MAIEKYNLAFDIGVKGSSGWSTHVLDSPKELYTLIEKLKKQDGQDYVLMGVEQTSKCKCGRLTPKSVLENLGECLMCDHVRGDLQNE